MNDRYVVSSCLLGEYCKYNGGHNRNEKVIEFLNHKAYISVCPEMLGGLPCPRPCCEINGKHILDEFKEDVSYEFQLGAHKALEKARAFQATFAILQPRSPSCGYGKVYNGKFEGKLISGNGWFTQLLLDENIEVINADDFLQFIPESMKNKNSI